MVVAFRVDDDERNLEGAYWLALLTSAAFPLPEDTLIKGELFETGTLVVEAQWYKLEQLSQRGYRLLPEKVILVVNAMIRVKDIAFEQLRGWALPDHR